MIECELCGAKTLNLGTRRCDGCWELETRIRMDPDLAERILRRVKPDRRLRTLCLTLCLLASLISVTSYVMARQAHKNAEAALKNALEATK